MTKLMHRVVWMGVLASWLLKPQLRAAESPGLACEKYTLDNGLTVILHVDHSLPTACINLWYRVGARNEPAGRSGFAHLFEHLMFMGTGRAPGSSFDDWMEAGGGANNADTTLDRTDYYSAGPSSILPLLLWLDADRLEALGPTMTQKKLDLQRDVVRNEIRQQVENRPYGREYEQSFRLLYPPGHPYHNAVYGTHQDLEAATVNDVKDFFATFYTPDNCSLVVAGDFEPAAVKPLIAGLFGTLPRGKPAPYPKVEPAKLDHVVRATMLDKVQLPLITVSYLSPASFAEGDAEMDLLAAVLAGGRDSRLYRRLVMEQKLAVAVSADQQGAALGSIFRIQATAKPGADLNKIESIIDEELARIAREGPTADELQQQAAKYELNEVTSLQDIRSRARRLNEYEYYFGNPDSLQRDLARYQSATRQGLQHWAAQVFTPDARLIFRVLPEEPKSIASARDKRPADLPPAPFKIPEPTKLVLSNGIPVYVYPKHDLPIIQCGVLIGAGGDLDTTARAGLGTLMGTMTQEGAGGRDSVAFAQAVAALGGRINGGGGDESISFVGTVLSRNAQPFMQLLADCVLRPRMEASDFERVKSTHLNRLRQRQDEPGYVAVDVALRMLMTEGDRRAIPIEGTVATVTPLSDKDIKDAYEALLHHADTSIIMAGDITVEKAKALLDENFAAWKTQPPAREDGAAQRFRPASGLRVYLVDRPNAVQTVIQLRAPAFPYGDPRRMDSTLANLALGGTFTSRLNRNLREVHGYTYGAHSELALRRTFGTAGASTSVKADVTGPALKEFMAEMRRLGTADMTADEAAKARETFRAETAQRFGTLGGLLSHTFRVLELGIPADSTQRDLARADQFNVQMLNAAAGSLVDLDHAVLVLVGDKKLILDQIKDLGLPSPVEVNADGQPQN